MMRDMMNDAEQRAQEIQQQIGRIGIYTRFSVDQGLQRDQMDQIDDLGWIVAQTEAYLARPETSEKLSAFVKTMGSQIGLITLDQLSDYFSSQYNSFLLTLL